MYTSVKSKSKSKHTKSPTQVYTLPALPKLKSTEINETGNWRAKMAELAHNKKSITNFRDIFKGRFFSFSLRNLSFLVLKPLKT